ncbi:MAG: hypothetical protein E3J72_15870 [Planctomycetota bacterium]|nr:MAG: hypothetical protein E3J72_15870 [Planctomycetota bacterium]
MRTSFSIAYTDDGQLQMRITGKFTGHAAREGLEFLRSAIGPGRRDVKLDLRETTSIDSLGIEMFNWIRGQNGKLSVKVLPPIMGVSDDELKSIALNSLQGSEPDNSSFRRARA